MKKVFLSLVLFLFCSLSLCAQKVAYIDSRYILDNIPAYHSAQEQLNKASRSYQEELEKVHKEIEKMQSDLKTESILMTADMVKRRKDMILTKQKSYETLQKKYFGKDGSIFKKRKSLIKPIQDDIFNALQRIAEEGSFAIIMDKALKGNIIFSDPKYDLSDVVLERLGYKN
ncbi:OmpH family outer membrane protein [Halosquirtibacter laminarini]|uniref:OmpH family outer membrane protein n=1 Tax=Halosquirtibacter laminarini TaxID=3374600 RepID=A0AC61NNX9_9BACT|nr:OmpH family outer membrane protein [Prolixibacteraceae bacterium]